MKAKFLALAALVLGLASCQTDTVNGVKVDANGEAPVTIQVGLPEEAATRAAGEDSGIGAIGNIDLKNGYDIRYILGVYDEHDELAKRIEKFEDERTFTTFDLRLVPGRHYRFVVWADFVTEGSEDALHYDASDLEDIKLTKNMGDNQPMDESRDAYTGVFNTADNNGDVFSSKTNVDMTLTRPFAKLRIVSNDMRELYSDLVSARVTYSVPLYTSFNALTATPDEPENNVVKKVDFSTMVYENEADPRVNGEQTLYADYLFGAEGNKVHFALDVVDDVTSIPTINFNTNIPVERNHLTTIYGPVLTDANNVTVTIDERFKGEYVNGSDVDTTESFSEALKAAEESVEATIDLTGDVVWSTGAGIGSTPWIPEGAKTQKLTINANGHKITATGAGVGAIRMANGGTLVINNAIIKDESVSYAENSWEYGYLEFAGKLQFNECEFVNAIMVEDADATFVGCKFNSNDDNQYAVWVSGNNASFKNCVVEGPRGIKMHEAYGSEIEKVVINKCQFNDISKKPGVAIGDVNADTKVVIMNSSFTHCQAGDQGLYIYETDTDVATFDFAENDNVVINTVTEGAKLDEMLQQNIKSLTIELGADVELNTSNAYLALGGEDTELIVIDGKKLSTAATGAASDNHKLTLTTTYWSRFTTKNPDAKVILRNLTLTSSQTTGTWNSYDVTLNCNVELVNVDLLKAVAFDGAGKSVKVKDVTIKESHDYYAMWIAAAGQTVNIENLVIESAGRGIKIDEQYVNDAVAKVTLNINDAKFTTQKKAAIVVKSVAGADITLQDVDINGVEADKVNAVWVDEDAKNYAGMVSVAGGSAIVEGATVVDSTQTSFAEAVTTENATVQLPVGSYTMPKNIAKNVTIICAEGTTFEGASSLDINGATVVGATFENLAGSAVSSTINGTLKDCTFRGSNALRYCYAGETVVFENCVFDGDVYGVHFDGGENDAIFRNCVFSGFNAFGSALTELVIDNCEFKALGNSNYNGANLWGKTTITNTTFDFDGSVGTEWIGLNAARSGKVISIANCTVTNGTVFDYFANYDNGNKVTVNGVVYEFVANGVIKADEDYEISSKAGMFWFANEVNVNKNAFSGKTVKLTANIDLNNEAWTPVGQTGATTFNGVFDGQEYTISNLNVNSEAQTGKHYSSGLFGWVESHTAGHGHIKNVKINGATIVGHHNCGALVGYITQETALVENCHVTGANVSCTYANGDADGDKAGALIGNATVATPVKGCTAANSTVSAGRDAGQVIGAGREANVTGCSAINVTVSANGTGTGANVRNEVIGRLL